MNINNITVRKMTVLDVKQVIIIENICCLNSVCEDTFLKQLYLPFAHFFVAEVEKSRKIAGYLGMWAVLNEAQVINIAVHPKYRKIGIASYLMKHMIKTCHNIQIDKIFLELRESNIQAINLYKKFGFYENGKRDFYYSNPKENAILMEYVMKKEDYL